jgi:AcrR family transcriptional regulator
MDRSDAHPSPAATAIGTQARLSWVRPAKQERSQRTHEHFLDTLEAMLEGQGIHTVQVKALAQQADLSVGGFYSRFVNKDGILRALCERFAIEAVVTAEDALAPARWSTTSLAQAIPHLVRFLADDYQRRPGFRRALVQVAATDEALLPMLQGVTGRVVAAIAGFLASKKKELSPTAAADVDATAELVHRLLFSTLDNHVLTAPAPGRRLGHDTVVQTLVQLTSSLLLPPTPDDVVASTSRLNT